MILFCLFAAGSADPIGSFSPDRLQVADSLLCHLSIGRSQFESGSLTSQFGQSVDQIDRYHNPGFDFDSNILLDSHREQTESFHW